MSLHHGTTIEMHGFGVFIKGASGAGKSDLAIRLMTKGAHLVADDYTNLNAANGVLFATAPDNIKGLIEAHGIGLIATKTIEQTQINLVVELVDESDIERMPEPQFTIIETVSLPLIFLCAKHASATAKLTLYLKSLE